MAQQILSVGRRGIWIGGAIGGVLLWRIAAYASPSSFIAIPEGLHLPHALLGILFLAAGAWAWWRRPNQWTQLFLITGIAFGIHWGGAVGITNPAIEMSVFWVYLALSALGDSALLHLALIYPHGRPLSRSWRNVLYLPALAAVMLAPVAIFVPQNALRVAIGTMLLIAPLLSLAAGVVFTVRLFIADAATRRAARLPLIVAGLWAGGITAHLGAANLLPGVPEAWNLALALLPITFAIALTHQSSAHPGDHEHAGR
ncbi:MAG TPA: hypothetical protein VGA37_14125 [Gemmatimonadales bacterium]